MLERARELDGHDLMDKDGRVVRSKASVPPMRLPMKLIRDSNEAKEFWTHFKLIKRIKKLEL